MPSNAQIKPTKQVDNDNNIAAITCVKPVRSTEQKIKIPKTNMKALPKIIRGGFDRKQVEDLLVDIHGEEKFKKMKDAGVDKRMVFGINEHYMSLVLGEELKAEDGRILVPKMPPSKALAALVLPRLEETLDLSGEKDPSNQSAYSPDDERFFGKIGHKYSEIVIGYTALACSAHCRYCYRLDLLGKTSNKTILKPENLGALMIEHNEAYEKNNGIDPKTGKKTFRAREAILSGGDILVQPNKTIFDYVDSAGKANAETVRFGTKELSFRPERVDDAFIETLKMLNARHPNMLLNFIVHFSHPDEFLVRDENNNYVKNDDGTGYKWMEESERALKALKSLHFVTLENQTPMISHVNDSVEAMHLLHQELRRAGVKPKYTFQGREIEGHAAFSIPVEKAWKIHNEAMKGISDGGRSRFTMSAEAGKMEVVSVTEETADEEGIIIFKIHRSPGDASTQGKLIIARRNPEALWITGYQDRIIRSL